jgi:predicted transposase YdaD
LESSSYTKAQLEIYDRYWDAVRTQRTYILDALDAGEAIGLQKGRTEGLQEGEAIGLQKGRAEGKAEAFKEIVLTAHRNGHAVAQIQEITGLSEEEVNKLLVLNS